MIAALARRARLAAWLRAEHARNSWMALGVAIAASAALGMRACDLIELARHWQ